MKGQPQINGNHAPSPPPSTEKTCYQGRTGVTPTRTYKPAFPDIEAGSLWPMAPYVAQGYTDINGREPNGMEKGHAKNQSTKGKMNNSFGNNI